MPACSRGSLPAWMTSAPSRVDLSGGAASAHRGASPCPYSSSSSSQAPSAARTRSSGWPRACSPPTVPPSYPPSSSTPSMSPRRGCRRRRQGCSTNTN